LKRLGRGCFVANGSRATLENLSSVNLAYNRIQELPFDELVSLKALTELNLANNKLTSVAEEFAALSKRNVDINITGNPLLCDCASRRRIDRVRISKKMRLTSQGTVDEWDSLVCNEPDNLRGRLITQLEGEELKCETKREREDVLNSDLLLRGSNWVRRDALYVVWLVRNATADIWEFELTMQVEDETANDCSENDCLRKVQVLYNARDYTFNDLDSRRAYRVCITAFDGFKKMLDGARHCITANKRQL